MPEQRASKKPVQVYSVYMYANQVACPADPKPSAPNHICANTAAHAATQPHVRLIRQPVLHNHIHTEHKLAHADVSALWEHHQSGALP